jgi:hypothetical protein
MSDVESHLSIFDDFSETENDYEGKYVNERGDRHSDESSSYHLSEKADPNSKKKKYVRRFNPDLGKNIRVEFFPTNVTPNSGIKHAITGIYQSANGRFFRTGTKDEDLFFSVILATGELSGQNTPVLFYENPEQYERHFFTKLSQQIKNKWAEKNQLALSRYNLRKMQEEPDNATRGIIVVK